MFCLYAQSMTMRRGLTVTTANSLHFSYMPIRREDKGHVSWTSLQTHSCYTQLYSVYIHTISYLYFELCHSLVDLLFYSTRLGAQQIHHHVWLQGALLLSKSYIVTLYIFERCMKVRTRPNVVTVLKCPHVNVHTHTHKHTHNPGQTLDSGTHTNKFFSCCPPLSRTCTQTHTHTQTHNHTHTQSHTHPHHDNVSLFCPAHHVCIESSQQSHD